MRFTMDMPGEINAVRSYGGGAVTIGANGNVERTLRAPSIVARHTLIADWPATSLAQLQPMHLDAVFALEPQIVIAGTTERERLAPADILRRCRERGVALEGMELGAACRTYNVLLQEERLVVAILFP
jgi:uncharacterized protein